jgi:hypothetical protein
MLYLSNNKVNKDIYIEHLKYLLRSYFSNIDYEIVTNNPYVAYNSFYPLPTHLITDEYVLHNKIVHNVNNDNIYSFYGTPNKNRILFGNRKLPSYDKYPIPFTFPIIINKKIELVNSNVYYYELTIMENIRESWLNETISIGYGSVNLPINTNPGWNNNSFGYHLDDGSFQCNHLIYKNVGPICNKDDIVGIGIIYISKNTYKPFLTFNGTLIELDFIQSISIKFDIVPIIGYDHSNKIKLNFSQEEFKFNVKNYLHNNKIISNENLFIKSEYDMKNINTEQIIIKKTPALNLPLFSLINNNTNLNLPIMTQNNEISEFIMSIIN